jgi:hypothetical protein
MNPQLLREAVDVSKTVAGDMRRIGSSKWAARFNASVPFSAAMLQSWSSIGSALKHDWKKFMVGASAMIGVPTMSEMAYNAALSEVSGTFPDQSFIDSGGVKGKEWTYNDYYWNGFTQQQRTDNFIYMVPGQPPWDAVLIPVSPEWGLFRGTVMEAADAIFGYSNVGAIGSVQPKVSRDMMLGAAQRVFDIPWPPLASAAASYLGMDIRLGLIREVKDDPDDPGSAFTVVSTHPIGSGERVTRRSGKTRFVQGDLDRRYVAMIQDIFGAAGTAYVNIHEAVNAGLTIGEDAGPIKAFGQGFDALGQSVKSQSRYLQPLLGKVLRPNDNDEISESLFASRQNLKNLATQMTNGYIGAGIVYANGESILGDAFQLKDDPINIELAASASGIEADVGKLDAEIAQLKKHRSTMGNATNLGSIREKWNKIDGMTLQIMALKAQQQSILHDFEDKLSTYLTDRYGTDAEGNVFREIEIDFRTFSARPNVQKGDLGAKELLKPRPRTQ